MKKQVDWVLIAAAILAASLMDIVLKPRFIPSAAIALLAAAAAFGLGLSRIRLGKYVKLLLLAANLILLALTFRSRYLFINIFLLSYLLWQWVTPYLARYKGLAGTSTLVVFLAAYILPLYGIPLPLLPLVFYPLFAAGYHIRDMKAEKSIKVLILLCVSGLFSIGAFAVIYFKLRNYTGLEVLKFLNFPKTGSLVAVYLPFFTIFFLGFVLAGCLFTRGLYAYIDRTEGAEGFGGFVRDLVKQGLRFVLFFAVTGALMFVLEYILRGSVTQTLRSMVDPAAMFNLLCLSTVYLVLLSLLGRSISTTLLTIAIGILAVANFIKVRYFDEPFYPWDTYLIKEAMTIAKGYVNLPLLAGLGIVLLLGIICAFVFLKPVRRFFRPRLVWTLLPFALVLLLINGIFINNAKMLEPLNIKKFWYIGKKEMMWNGVLVQNYFYLKEYDKYAFNKPGGYSKEAMAAIEKRLAAPAAPKTASRKPNIVLIMSESFWDPTKLNGVTFNQDIMKSFRPYEKGEMVSPAVGGGTANVEFEALTGFSNYFDGPGVLAYNVYIRKNTPSIVSTLKDNGYKAIAIHPYKADMYNRNKVYKYLQFDQFIDETSFNYKTDVKGPYISDDKLMDKITSILDEGDQPKFIFAVTMQNHDPYINKYRKPEVTAQSSKLSEKEASILGTYGVGINDAGKALDNLIRNLSKSKTPTLVYFFGDHLPRLGSLQDMLDIYERLNPEGTAAGKALRTYSTPYASWSNYMDIPAFTTPVSPARLAYEILKDSGVTYPSYFNILGELDKKYPYLQKEISGNVDMKDPNIRDYQLIQYDLLFGDQYLWKTKK